MTPAQHLAHLRVMIDITRERHRQHAIHGEQNLRFASGYFIRDRLRDLEDAARRAQENGVAGWDDLRTEEHCEVARAPTLAERRTELVQLGALCAQEIEAIDRELAAKGA